MNVILSLVTIEKSFARTVSFAKRFPPYGWGKWSSSLRLLREAPGVCASPGSVDSARRKITIYIALLVDVRFKTCS